MKKEYLKQLPAVDDFLADPGLSDLLTDQPRAVVVMAIREVLDELRLKIMAGGTSLDSLDLSTTALIHLVSCKVTQITSPRLRRVVNGTGVVVHTNLGRSILAESAVLAIDQVARNYCNLEYDVEQGARGSRHDHIRDLIIGLTKAEDAIAVNNNAAAVLLALTAIAKDKEVVVSRGELVEIGGSFRIPDVMRQSGARLVEVATTNKTHYQDYANATNENTALLLKVHTSNFKIIGFTSEVSVPEMVALGRETGIAVMHDLGSGLMTSIDSLGFIDEPTVDDSIKAGVDLITFSGDKLLGGPQAGIILGKSKYVEICRRHPLARAVRIDKFTLSALEATLRLYLDSQYALQAIPTLRMLSEKFSGIEDRAQKLAARLTSIAGARYDVKVITEVSKAGGGALPLIEIPTVAVSVSLPGVSINELESRIRSHEPPVIARIKDDRLVFDARTITMDDLEIIAAALRIADRE